MKTKQFKVLLVYPNLMLVSLLPNNIALLSACLKESGIDVKVFDTTLYQTEEKSNDELRVDRLQVRKFNINDAGIKLKKENIFTDFNKLVEEYKPNLVGVSVVDDTVELGLKLIESADIYGKIPTIFGGVNAMLNSTKLIKNKYVDMICMGEGEHVLVEVCKELKKGFDWKSRIKSIDNLVYIDDNGLTIKNKLRVPADLNTLPYEDFSVFEEQRLYRPMQGKMISMIPINFDRGCPYTCTFCGAPAILSLYKEQNHKYYRVKSIDRIREEMKYQISKYDISYFYFNSETFLAMSKDKLQEFSEMYKEFNLPFWCQTRIETITDEKIKLLKEMNCDRLSIGVEHGNEEFRKKILHKKFTNKQVVDAFKIFNKYKLKVSVNNIIGFPEETRELIFDTIKLNKQINVDSINGFVFQPYKGTYLRNYCIEKGYLSENNNETSNPIGYSLLNMSQISKEEIEGLIRTFVLYIKLPEEYHSKIKIAEQLDEKGDEMLCELTDVLYDKYYFKD